MLSRPTVSRPTEQSIGYLHKMLDLLQQRDDVIFVRGGQIADWFNRVSPAG